MAKLNKEQYFRRNENAARRNEQNKEIAVDNGMSEDWANLINELCRVRHKLHCNIDTLVNSSEGTATEIRNSLRDINTELKEGGYKYIDSLPSNKGDYIDIDSIDDIMEIEDLPSDFDERDKYLSERYEEIYDQWSEVNSTIEAYLRSIDKKYGTSWCPTGTHRMLW